MSRAKKPTKDAERVAQLFERRTELKAKIKEEIKRLYRELGGIEDELLDLFNAQLQDEF